MKPALSTNRTKVLPIHWQNASHDANRWTVIMALLQIIQAHKPTTHQTVMCTFLLLLLSLTLPQSWFAVTGPQQWHPSIYCSGSHDQISKYVGRNKSLLITTVKYSVLLIYTYLIAVTQIFIQKHPAAASKTIVAAGRSLWPTGVLVHLCTLISYRFLC